MTPAQYYPYVKAWKDKEWRLNYRSGVITYVMRAIMGDKKAEPMDMFEDKKAKLKQARLRIAIKQRREKDAKKKKKL